MGEIWFLGLGELDRAPKVIDEAPNAPRGWGAVLAGGMNPCPVGERSGEAAPHKSFCMFTSEIVHFGRYLEGSLFIYLFISKNELHYA